MTRVKNYERGTDKVFIIGLTVDSRTLLKPNMAFYINVSLFRPNLFYHITHLHNYRQNKTSAQVISKAQFQLWWSLKQVLCIMFYDFFQLSSNYDENIHTSTSTARGEIKGRFSVFIYYYGYSLSPENILYLSACLCRAIRTPQTYQISVKKWQKVRLSLTAIATHLHSNELKWKSLVPHMIPRTCDRILQISR